MTVVGPGSVEGKKGPTDGVGEMRKEWRLEVGRWGRGEVGHWSFWKTFECRRALGRY